MEAQVSKTNSNVVDLLTFKKKVSRDKEEQEIKEKKELEELEEQKELELLKSLLEN